MIFCPNLSNKTVAKEFNELVDILGEEIAYDVWHKNKGNHISKTPDGKDNPIFKQLEENIGREDAVIEMVNRITGMQDMLIKPGISELFESNLELANQVYEALGFKQTIIQDNNSYYRGQIEKPIIDEEGNLILYGREDELYKKAGLESKGVSMTDDLQSAIEYGNGQLEVAQNVLEEQFGYDVLGYEFEDKIREIQDGGYYLIQIPKKISNKIVKEAGEVKVIGDKIIIPKGQYKIEQVVDRVEQITSQQKQQAQQLYSQYVEQTGKQDIQGFKEFVSNPIQSSQNSYAQLESKQDNAVKQLDLMIKAYLDKIGVRVEAVDSIKTYTGDSINAIGKADILNRVIQVVKKNAKKDTLPHEASHFFVELLGDSNPMLIKMMKDIESMDIYNEVYDLYKNLYTKEVNGKIVPDIEKIKKEAIGQAIAEEILNIFNETEANKSLIRKFIDRILNWFGTKIGKVDFTPVNEFAKAAKDILNAEVETPSEDVFKTLHNGLHYVEYYQQDDVKDEVAAIREKLNKPLVYKEGKSYFEVGTGRKIAKRVSDYVKAFSKRFNKRAAQEEEKEINIIKRKKGKLFHKIGEILQKKIYNSDVNQDMSYNDVRDKINSYSYANIKNQVISELIAEEEDFVGMDKNDNFFNLGYFKDGVETGAITNYKAITNMVIAQYWSFRETQAEINTKTGTKEKFTLHSELMIYDESEDMAGTIDLLVVYSNGKADLFDYKTINFTTSPTGEVISTVGDIRRREYNIQLGKYTTSLMEQYGIKGFNRIRVTPARVQLDYKNPNAGFYKIETGYGTTSKPYLDEIPMDKELTDSKKINNALKSLIKERDALVKLQEKDFRNLSIKGKLDKINTLIKRLQLRSDVKLIFDDISLFIKGYKAKAAHGEDSKNSLSFSDISDYVDYIKFYKKALQAVTEGIDVEDKTDNSLVFALGRIIQQMEDLDAEISSKIISMTLEMTGKDLTLTHNEEKAMGKYMQHLNEFNPVAFQVLTKIRGKLLNDVRLKTNTVIESIEVKRKDVIEWGKANNWSLNKINKWLTTEEGRRQLVSKWSTKFWEDREKAVDRQDKEWFLDNTKIYKLNGKYYYSDEVDPKDPNKISPKKWFDNELAIYKQTLDEKYGEINKEAHKRELELWKSKYDITNNPETAFNNSNKFLQAKDKSEFHSEKWNEMIKPENKPLLDYYLEFVNLNRQFMSITHHRVESERFMPAYMSDIIDKLGENGVTGIKDILPSIKNIARVREFDEMFGSIDSETGKPLRSIPLYGLDTITVEADDAEIKAIEDEAAIKFKDNLNSVAHENYVESQIIKLEASKGNRATSGDLAKSFSLFAESAYMFEALHATEDLVKSLEYFVNILNNEDVARKIISPSGNLVFTDSSEAETTLGYNQVERDAFTKFINLYWYGQNMQDQDIQVTVEKLMKSLGANEKSSKKIGEKAEKATYSISKWIEWLNSFLGLKILGLNYISGSSNAIGMLANLSYAGLENKYFSKAIRKTANLMQSDFKKYTAIGKYFEVYTQKRTNEKANKVSSSWLARNLTSETMYMFMKNPSEMIDNSILVAMMYRYGLVKDKDGNSKLQIVEDGADNALINLFKYNEFKDTWEIEGLSDWDFADFRQKVQWQSTLTKGDIPDDNKVLAQTTLAGKIFGKFRWWMLGYIKKRTKGMQYDTVMEDFDVGRFRIMLAEFHGRSVPEFVKNTTLQLIEMVLANGYTNIRSEHHKRVAEHFFNKFITENPQYKGKITLEQYIEMRKNKLKAASTEIRTYLSWLLMLKFMSWLFFGAGDDDRKKQIEQDETYLGMLAKRVTWIISAKAQHEFGSMLNPYSTLRSFMISPAVIFSIIKDIDNISSNTVDELYRDLGWKEGRNDTPEFHYLKRLVPVGQTFERTFDLNDSFKYQQIR